MFISIWEVISLNTERIDVQSGDLDDLIFGEDSSVTASER